MIETLLQIRKWNIIYQNDLFREQVEDLINYFIPIEYKIMPKGSLNKKVRRRQLVVSLTSIPSRIDKVHYSIASILKQNVKPDKIILWLGEDDFKSKKLPHQLIELEKKGLEIRYRKDIRAHTKYYYAMQEMKDAIIITIDDDIYYEKNMIRGLTKTYQKNRKCVCAHWVWEMKMTAGGKLLESRLFPGGEKAKDNQEPSHKLLALGCGGVLYPPNCFGEEAFNLESIKKLSWLADDVWLKGMEVLYQRKVAKVNEKYKPDVIVSNTQKVALRHTNVGHSQNDVQLNAVFENYHINSKIEKETT